MVQLLEWCRDLTEPVDCETWAAESAETQASNCFTYSIFSIQQANKFTKKNSLYQKVKIVYFLQVNFL